MVLGTAGWSRSLLGLGCDSVSLKITLRIVGSGVLPVAALSKGLMLSGWVPLVVTGDGDHLSARVEGLYDAAGRGASHVPVLPRPPKRVLTATYYCPKLLLVLIDLHLIGHCRHWIPSMILRVPHHD